MAEKDTVIFEYAKLKSGHYTMWRTFRTAYAHDTDGSKLGEARTFAEVMKKRDSLERMAKRSNYKFESHRRSRL